MSTPKKYWLHIRTFEELKAATEIDRDFVLVIDTNIILSPEMAATIPLQKCHLCILHGSQAAEFEERFDEIQYSAAQETDIFFPTMIIDDPSEILSLADGWSGEDSGFVVLMSNSLKFCQEIHNTFGSR